MQHGILLSDCNRHILHCCAAQLFVADLNHYPLFYLTTIPACDGVQCHLASPSAFSNPYTGDPMTGPVDTALGCAVLSIYDLNCNAPSNLTYLNLESGVITSLPPNAFAAYSGLVNLMLGWNSITNVDASAFSANPNLEIVELYTNSLSSIPAAVFSGLSKLQVIDLAYNYLTAIPVGLFSGLKALQLVYVRGVCMTELINPCSLLYDNMLTSVPIGLFDSSPNLAAIELSNNFITMIPTGVFSNLPKLRYLSLSANPAVTFASNAFAGMALSQY